MWEVQLLRDALLSRLAHVPGSCALPRVLSFRRQNDEMASFEATLAKAIAGDGRVVGVLRELPPRRLGRSAGFLKACSTLHARLILPAALTRRRVDASLRTHTAGNRGGFTRRTSHAHWIRRRLGSFSRPSRLSLVRRRSVWDDHPRTEDHDGRTKPMPEWMQAEYAEKQAKNEVVYIRIRPTHLTGRRHSPP